MLVLKPKYDETILGESNTVEMNSVSAQRKTTTAIFLWMITVLRVANTVCIARGFFFYIGITVQMKRIHLKYEHYRDELFWLLVSLHVMAGAVVDVRET